MTVSQLCLRTILYKIMKIFWSIYIILTKRVGKIICTALQICVFFDDSCCKVT